MPGLVDHESTERCPSKALMCATTPTKTNEVPIQFRRETWFPNTITDTHISSPRLTVLATLKKTGVYCRVSRVPFTQCTEEVCPGMRNMQQVLYLKEQQRQEIALS